MTERDRCGNAFGNKMDAEAHPEDPPTSLEIAVASARNIPDFVEIKLFRAVDSQGMVRWVRERQLDTDR